MIIYSIACALAGMMAGVAVTALIVSKRDTEEHVFAEGAKAGAKKRTNDMMVILDDIMYRYVDRDIVLAIEDAKAQLYKLAAKDEETEGTE
jgi:hypothetical protein